MSIFIAASDTALDRFLGGAPVPHTIALRRTSTASAPVRTAANTGALATIPAILDSVSERLGRLVSWAVLAMALAQFFVVAQRYVFSLGDVFTQELVVYLHGALILLGAGYAFFDDGHVRVDVFYREMSSRARDWVDLVGSAVFLLPMCAAISWSAWPNVVFSWSIGEGSIEPGGVPFKYALKSLVLTFAVLLAMHAVSIMAKAALRLALADRREETRPRR